MSLAIDSLPQIIKDNLPESSKECENVIWWCGAGISSLSGLPLGNELTEKALEFFGNPNLLYEIKELYRFAKEKNFTDREMPRLESVYQNIYKIFGPEALDHLRLFSSEANEENLSPNDFHFFLADRISKGDWVYTTNYDDLIEVAWNHQFNNKEIRKYIYPQGYPATDNRDSLSGIVKVHGCAATDPRALGILHERVSIFPSDPMWKHLISLLNDKSSLFIVLGYSGLDTMDILPLFTHKNMDNWQASAIWINHDDNAKEPTKNSAPRYQSGHWMLNSFKKANNVCVSGITTKLLNLKHQQIKQYDWKSKVFHKSNIVITDAEKALFSTSMYLSLGYILQARKEYDTLSDILLKKGYLSDHQTEIYKELEMNILRDEGLYKKEIVKRKKKYLKLREENIDLFSIVWAKTELEATMRLMGQYIPAWRSFLQMTRKSPKSGLADLYLDTTGAMAEESSVQFILPGEYFSWEGYVDELPIINIIRRLFVINILKIKGFLAFHSFAENIGKLPMVVRPKYPMRITYYYYVMNFSENWFKDIDSFIGQVNNDRDSVMKELRRVLKNRLINNNCDELKSLHYRVITQQELAKHIGDLPGYYKAIATNSYICNIISKKKCIPYIEKKQYRTNYHMLLKQAKTGYKSKIETNILGWVYFQLRFLRGY